MPPNELHKFGAGARVSSEDALHGTGDKMGVFLQLPHGHAQVKALDDDPDPLGCEGFHQEVGDLVGESLLELELLREMLDDLGNLAHADHAAVGNIADVRFAKEGQNMMLAERMEQNIFHDDHLVVFDGEDRPGDQFFGVLAVARRERLEHLREASWGSGASPHGRGLPQGERATVAQVL